MSIYVIGLQADLLVPLAGPFEDGGDAAAAKELAVGYVAAKGWKMTVGVAPMSGRDKPVYHDEVMAWAPPKPTPETVHSNPFFRVDTLIGQDGRRWFPVAVAGAPGAVAVPRLPNGDFVLVEQYRGTLDRRTLEFPRGGSKHGETAAVTAARAALEETGYAIERAVRLGTVHPDTALLASGPDVFLVELGAWAPRKARTEITGVRSVSPPQLRAMIRTGEVSDGLTLAAYTLLTLNAA